MRSGTRGVASGGHGRGAIVGDAGDRPLLGRARTRAPSRGDSGTSDPAPGRSVGPVSYP